jgi:hemerythrin
MAIITWNEEFSVKVRDIDDQHKELISIINDLHDEMNLGKSKEFMSEILKRLIDYTIYHFGTEEKYMTEYNYPDMLQHETKHEKLTKEVLSFQIRFSKGDVTISMEILNFLKDWLTNHILQTDKKLGAFLSTRI